MRSVRFSRTALEQLNEFLARGVGAFGARVAAEKRDRVFNTIEHFLAARPEAKRAHPQLGLHVYPISRTPFVVLYDFDEQELRIHLILHRHADLDALDVTTTDW